MDLRRFLFNHRISQVAIVRAAARCGYVIYGPDVSNLVQGKMKLLPLRAKVREALKELGFTAEDLNKVKELN